MGLLILGCAALLPAAAGNTPADVDGSTWRVEHAEAIQREAQRQAALAKAATPAETEAALERLHRQETGVGEPAHAPADPAEVERQARRAVEQQRIDDLQAHAFAQSRRTGESVGKSMERLLGEPGKAASLAVTLATQQDGPLNGGYVYAFVVNGDVYGASSYAAISATGQTTLALPSGSTLDLYLFPNAPFAAQMVRVEAVQNGATILFQPARKVSLQREMPEGGVYSGSLRMNFTFSTAPGLYGFSYSVAPDENDPAVYLAEGTDYRSMTALVEEPWFAEPIDVVAPTQSSLALRLRHGYLLELELLDPDALLTGCSPSLAVRRDARLGAILLHSQGRVVYDASSRPTGIRASLPKGRPLDVLLTFSGASCNAQGWELRGARFTEDARLSVRVQPASRPQFSFRTVAGESLGYLYGYFRPLDAPGTTHAFTPASVSSMRLIAGRHYDVNVITDSSQRLKPASTRVIAQAGSFPVVVETERLAKLTLRLQPQTAQTYLSGLLQARRNGVLEAAFEVRTATDHVLELPPGEYQFAFSGLGGSYTDASSGRAVLLKAFAVPYTLTTANDQRLEVPIALPAAGVRFAARPMESLPVHLVAMQGGRPLAATELRYWQIGLLSDITPLELRLNGPGFDQVALSVVPTAAQPSIDLNARANNSTRLAGTLRDSAGVALANTRVYLYSAEGLSTGHYRTDAQGRFDLPKVRGSLMTPMAPDGGGDLAGWQPISSPQAVVPADIALQSLDFLPVSADGPTLQRFHGSGNNRFRVVFVSESYTTLREHFTDQNGNGVWDGRLFLDFNRDGLWQEGEPVKSYGQRSYPAAAEQGTDIRVGNEPFIDENGDGYPSIDDYAVFAQNARNYVRALLASPDIRDGLEFDAYLLFLPSEQAGMDVIDVDDTTTLLERNTRFGARLTRARSLLVVDYDAVRAAIAGHLPEWNLQVVMINQPVAAGRANSFIIGYGGIGNSSPNDATPAHEFGHNPGGLADEYDEFGGTSITWFPASVGHLTHIPDDLQSPWLDLLDARLDEPVSTPFTPGIGLYAGGSYNAGGAYRPTSNSRMRYNSPEFNAPSRRVLSRAFCRLGLTEAQLSVALPAPGAGSVFRAGFESSYTLAGNVCP